MTDFLTAAFFAALYTFLLVLLWRVLRERKIAITLVAALLFNTSLLLANLLGDETPVLLQQFKTSSVLFGYVGWTLAILWVALRLNIRSRPFLLAFWGAWFFAAATLLAESSGLVFADWFRDTLFVIFAFITLYAFERVIRSDRLSLDERTVIATMGSLVALDIFYLSLSIADLPAAAWIGAFRPYAYVLVGLGLCAWSAYRLSNKSRLRLSYQAAEGSWSLLTLALVVSVMITSSTLIQSGNSALVNVLLSGIIVALLVLVFLGSVSGSARNQIRVFLNKHFFSHRFDYRAEWKNVSEALGRRNEEIPTEKIALDVLINATGSQAGVLWVRAGGAFQVVHSTLDTLEKPQRFSILDSAPMAQRMLTHQWIFAVKAEIDSAAGQFNEDLPDWFGELANFWLVLPITVNDELIGFAGLTCGIKVPPFDYESLDIARLTSSQVAGFLRLHHYERAQEENARFAVYSQMSSFLMHDLNNVLHQQKLLLKNAEKHRDNPEFMDDVLETVDNSVNRLQTLIGRLGVGKAEASERTNLRIVVETAIDLYSNQTSRPRLELHGTLPDIACDRDKLAMAIGHIVKNAQDASAGGEVCLEADTQAQYARVRIQDSGPGMTEDFINNKLFKPFETTKQSGGMGIGVYLTKTYVEQLGGMVKVDSQPGRGTLFSLFLPLNTGATHA